MTTEPHTAEFAGTLATPPAFHRQWMLAGNPARFIECLIRDHGDFIRYRGIIDFHLINHPALVRQLMRETHRDFDFGAPALGPALPLGYLELLILKTGFSLIASHLQMWPERACSRVS